LITAVTNPASARINRMLKITALLLLATSAIVMCASVDAMSGFAGPPKAKVQWVSQNIKTLGMQMQIRRFETISMSDEQVLQHYRDKWQEQAAETDNRPWKMIGTRSGDQYFNVQVQGLGRHGAWGYLSVSDLPAIADRKKKLEFSQGAGFPKMSGSRVINDQKHSDYGRKARTLLIENSFSVSANAIYYRQHYAAKGFAAVTDFADTRKKNHVLLVNKDNTEVAVTIHRINGKTQVVANEVKHGK
jgi:hypothetical protein